MSDYTPTTEAVREQYTHEQPPHAAENADAITLTVEDAIQIVDDLRSRLLRGGTDTRDVWFAEEMVLQLLHERGLDI